MEIMQKNLGGLPSAREVLRKSFVIELIGAGIQASLSPRLHETEARRLGLQYVYRLIDTDQLGLGQTDLPAILRAVEWAGFDGLNITHPFKQAIIPLLDDLSPEAQAIGAVNTITWNSGRRMGHNTDAAGFARGLQLALKGVTRGRVLQLGAGGAGGGDGLFASGIRSGSSSRFGHRQRPRA